jgi:hypothetical protein
MFSYSKLLLIAFLILSGHTISAQTHGTKTIDSSRAEHNITTQAISGSLSRLYVNTQCGLEYKMQSVRLGKRFQPEGEDQPAQITFNNIPGCANILKVFAWTEVLGYAPIPVQLTVTDSASFTNTYQMTHIGSSIDVCWNMGATHVYRSEITGTVNGNGNYWISGLPTSSDTNSYDLEGITIMVIYTNPNSTTTGTLVLDDGNITTEVDTISHLMNSYSVCSNPNNAEAIFITGDHQMTGLNMSWNSTTLTEPSWNWWNSSSHTITMSINDTTSDFTLHHTNDCITLAVAGLYFQTNCNSCSVTGVLSLNVSTTPSTCNGNGNANISVSGGTPPYQFQIGTDPAQSNSTFSNLSPGTYTLQITDAAGNCAGQNFTIANDELIINSLSINNARCLVLGSSSVSAIGGTAPYYYSWDNNTPNLVNGVSNLTIGYHIVLITDANGACADSVFQIGNDSTYYAYLTATHSSCTSPTGTATATMINGTPPFSFLWSTVPTQTSSTATGLAPGTYNLSITDSLGCVANVVAHIPYGPLPNFITYLVSKDSICNQAGLNSGKLRIGPITGGVGPFSVWWNTTPVQYNDTAFGLAAGSYIVTVLDSGTGCTRTSVRNVTSVPAFDVNLSRTVVSCSNNGTAAISTIVGGDAPFTYSWHTIPPQTTYNITGLTPGFYAVTVTDSRGCSIDDSINVNSNPLFNINYGYTALHKCDSFYTDTARFTAFATGGGVAPFSYQWGTTPPILSDTAFFTAPDTVLLTVTDANGCVNTRTVYVGASDEFAVLNQTTAGCGNAPGTANLTAPLGSGYTYLWNTNPPATSNTITAIPGTYQVSVSDTNGCTITKSITIPNGAAVNVLASSWVANCDTIGGSVYAYTSGGTPPFLYMWNSNSQLNTAGLWGLGPATYSVQVTDQCGNTDTSSVVVIGNGYLGVTASLIPLMCNSPALSYLTVTSGTPPYTYQWNTIPIQNSDTLVTSVAGNYSYSVTDSTGCQTVGMVTIPNAPFPLNVSAPTNVNCLDTILLVASSSQSNISYLWQPGNISNDSLQVMSMGNTTYTLTATASCGTVYDTVNISVLPNSIVAPICGVSVDTTNNLNVIQWNPLSAFGHGNYCLYHETPINSGIYLPLTTLPAQYGGSYQDATSSPSNNFSSYELATIDSCGDTSQVSLPFSTIFSTISSGANGSWDITWTPYVGGNVVDYKIYSSANGNPYTLIGTVGSNTFSFNDPSPAGVVTNYCVAATTGNYCGNQTTSPFISYSNIVVGSTVGINQEPDNNNSISVYPNPSQGMFQVTTKIPLSYSITDITGQGIQNGICKTGSNTINVSQLSTGIYFIIFRNEAGNTTTERLIIERE